MQLAPAKGNTFDVGALFGAILDSWLDVAAGLFLSRMGVLQEGCFPRYHIHKRIVSSKIGAVEEGPLC